MSLPSREGSDEVQDSGSRREDCRHADKQLRAYRFWNTSLDHHFTV